MIFNCLLLFYSSLGFAEPEIERVFNLTSRKDLEVINYRGDLEIHGWSQERVRVFLTKVPDQSLSSDEKEFWEKNVEISFKDLDRSFEVQSEYGKSLSLSERLRELEKKPGKVHLKVFAPYRLKLRVRANTGNVRVSNWRNSVEIKLMQGELFLEDIQGERLDIQSLDSWMRLQSIESSIRIVSDAGKIEINQCDSEFLYIDSAQSPIQMNACKFRGSLRTDSASIQIRNSDGEVYFETRAGSFRTESFSGSISGQSLSGEIWIQADEWTRRSKLVFLESTHGSVELRLPPDQLGIFDLKSETSTVESYFLLEDLKREVFFSEWGPFLGGSRRFGRIGGDAPIFYIRSGSGSIRVLPFLRKIEASQAQ